MKIIYEKVVPELNRTHILIEDINCYIYSCIPSGVVPYNWREKFGEIKIEKHFWKSNASALTVMLIIMHYTCAHYERWYAAIGDTIKGYAQYMATPDNLRT